MFSSFASGIVNNVGSSPTRAANQMPTHEEEQDENADAEREDLLDQHVAYYMKHHPEMQKKHQVKRIGAGMYKINGREIEVEWHYAEEPGADGYLIAIDGVLTQPFSDYMEGTEHQVNYDTKRLGKSSLSQIPKGKRLSFGDANKAYSRLEAMKVAKEQALVREKAAEFSKVGMDVPQEELMSKYQKTISQKLGERRQRRPEPTPTPAPQEEPPTSRGEAVNHAAPPVAPNWWPASKPSPAAAQESPAAATPSQKGKQTHGQPKYCANHNDTAKRKKCKPQNLPCSHCQTVIQTNYVDFSICPTCSEKDHRCMCCGSAAVGAAPSPSPSAQPAPSPRVMESSPSPRASPPPASVAISIAPASMKGKKQTHGAPKYCAKHNDTTKRKKCKPRELPCSNCQTGIQTNYVEFDLCPTCSENDHRCMCCAAPAVGGPPSTPQGQNQEEDEEEEAEPSPDRDQPKWLLDLMEMRSSPPPARASSKTPQSARASSKTPTAHAPAQAPAQPPAEAPQAPMSPMRNLFGMPDLYGSKTTESSGPGPQGGANALFNSAASALKGLAQNLPAQGYAATNPMACASPQHNKTPNNVFVSQSPMASASPQNAFASQNVYTSQNAYASQNVYTSQSPLASQNAYVSQNAFTSYNAAASANPMASQNVVVGAQNLMASQNDWAQNPMASHGAQNPMASQNVVVGAQRRF